MIHFLLFFQFDYMADQAVDTYDALELCCQSLAFLFGLVGALRIYNRWQLHGRHLHIDKEIVGWLGAAVFFLLVDQFISRTLL